jgi:hypothetical protein
MSFLFDREKAKGVPKGSEVVLINIYQWVMRSGWARGI